MILIPPKLFLTSNDGRNFIRFVNKHLHLWAEVLQFDTEADALNYIEQATLAVMDNGMSKAHFQSFCWNGNTWYVVFALEYFVSSPEKPIQKIEKMVDFRIKKLTSWIKYTMLIPQNNEYNDDDDTDIIQ
jgi:hypothetical protein